MNVIIYARRHGSLECDEIRQDFESPETELRFDEKLCGTLKLGPVTKKIDGNSCFFNTGSLEDGIYQPKIYLSGYIIEPESFEVKSGAPKLLPKNDEYVRTLSRELESLRRELSGIKERLSDFDEKINGHPIF